MLTLNRYDLPLGIEAQHVIFADEVTLAFTTSTADVWKVVASPMSARPELLLSGRSAISPVAQALGQVEVKPAGGGYPRIAVSQAANIVVVNTHDMVLIGCRLNGDKQPQLFSFSWGQYYPHLAFSSDGSRIAAKADILSVYDTLSWSGCSIDAAETSCWHPRQLMHLCVGYDGELFWADWSQGAAPVIRQLGTIGVRNGWNQARGLVMLEDGERFMVAFHPPRLELWRLRPLRMIESLGTDDGEIFDCRLSPDGQWVVILSARGARFWNTEAPFELSNLYPEITDLEFAPCGRRFVTHELAGGTNPWPADRTIGRVAAGGDIVSVWEICE